MRRWSIGPRGTWSGPCRKRRWIRARGSEWFRSRDERSAMLKRLIPFSKPARRDAIAGVGMLALGAFVEILQPWPIKWLVDYVFGSVKVPRGLSTLLPMMGKEHVG